MRRAAVTGLLDCRSFDPFDNWHWRRLGYIFEEFSRESRRELAQARHLYFGMRSTHVRLDANGVRACLEDAQQAYTQLHRSHYSWLPADFEEQTAKQHIDQMAAQYHEVFGRPGEPAYDRMVQQLQQVLARPKTQAEKDADRARWRKSHRSVPLPTTPTLSAAGQA